MEEKDKKNIEIPQNSYKRKVSIFKRRRKSNIRPFVQETKLRKFKKILFRLFIIFLVLSFLSSILWSVRYIVLPFIFEVKNTNIISPTSNSLQIQDFDREIKKSGFDATNLKFSKDFSTLTFMIHQETEVRINTKGDLKSDLSLLKKIENQMTEGNIRAIYIDLRYNKPIVKF